VREAHGRRTSNVRRQDISATLSQVIQCRVDVPGVPERDRVHHQAQRVELVFLSFPIPLAELAPLPVEGGAGQAVAEQGRASINSGARLPW
jgi:hypothetical protein